MSNSPMDSLIYAESIDSMVKGEVIHTNLPSEVGYGNSFTIVFNESVRASVVALLSARGPLAIVRRVISVVINTVKLASRRAFTHIREEVFKAVQPSVAHLDPATTVSVVMLVLLITASFLGSSPSSIFRSLASIVCHSSESFKNLMGASTTLGLAEKSASLDIFDISAIAPTAPSSLYSQSGRNVINDLEKSEGHSEEMMLNWSRHSTSLPQDAGAFNA
jgi:hypothetical protein